MTQSVCRRGRHTFGPSLTSEVRYEVECDVSSSHVEILPRCSCGLFSPVFSKPMDTPMRSGGFYQRAQVRHGVPVGP